MRSQKRMASEILNVGVNKVWFDPLRAAEIKQAITKQDIRDLIKDKAIRARPGKKKIANERRERRGVGRKKMTVRNRKRKYINLIRKIRTYVREQSLPKESVFEIRKLAKAGSFKSLRNVKEHIKLNKK